MKLKALLIIGLVLLMVTPNIFGKSSILVFVTDLYDQRSIKPQEKGSMLEFPIGSVTTDGKLMEFADGNFDWISRESNPKTTTKNPRPATPESLANGKLKFNTFCGACHGDGKTANKDFVADSKVNTKGMYAPVLAQMTPGLSDGYIFYKAKYASGAIMPPLGYSTTDEERWDIVNYIRQKVEAK